MLSAIPGYSLKGKVSGGNKKGPTLKQNPNWPIEEGPQTPKLCMGGPTTPSEAAIRRIKQLGVTHVITGGGANPWKLKDLKRMVRSYERYGMKVQDTYITGFDKAIRGEEGRDKQIENVKKSIRVAGKVGLPVLEYNWYAHRAMEGYYEVEGRGGAGYTAFDYDRMKNLPPLEGIKAISAKQLWANYTYFLKEIIPVAEEAGVRMAVHPNDPPAPKSRGSDQILRTFDDFKHLINIVDSPSNGMTGHPGYYNELGIDGLKVLRYLGSRDRINHLHYRNTLMFDPYKKYYEVFPDNGQVDMFAAMRQIVRLGYTRGIIAEHPRALDYDRENNNTKGQYKYVGGGGYAGFAYNTAYARAMMQAAMMAEGKS
jgi:mannonate dehydratase